MKKFFKFIGIAFVALLVLSMMFGGEEETKTEVVKSSETKKVEDNKPKEKEQPKEEKVAKIGDTLKVGDVEFKVNARAEAQQVGGQYVNEKAQGKYLVLDTTVTNKGKEAITVDSSFFKLLADGKEYESDSGASITANENADFFLSQLNPDLSLSGKVVFDIPAELHGKTLTLQVQTGFFGTETGEIELQ